MISGEKRSFSGTTQLTPPPNSARDGHHPPMAPTPTPDSPSRVNRSLARARRRDACILAILRRDGLACADPNARAPCHHAPHGDGMAIRTEARRVSRPAWTHHRRTRLFTSRNGKDLLRCFPEVAQAARVLPPGTILDGEIVIADDDGVPDFGALQSRLATSPRQLREMTSSCPAVLLVFDVLELAGSELLEQPLAERRRHLEALLRTVHPCLQLVEQIASAELAREWLARAPAVEGVVAKRADGRYRPGHRGWLKVKRQRSVDCVVVGIAGDKRMPMLVLGLRDAAGQLRTFGVTRTVPESLTAPIVSLLVRAGPAQAPIPSRWQYDQVPVWRPVPPEAVCEVRFSNLELSVK